MITRQLLLGRNPSAALQHRVKDLAQLQHLLQSAVKLELTTIPPYLCALYSIKASSNREAVEAILSVVMEEMLHMALAANVLNAIGGTPIVNEKEFVPSYPQTVKTLNMTIPLERFCKSSIDTFIEIERPDDEVHGQPCAGCCHYDDAKFIAQFYALIKCGLKDLSEDGTINIFDGDPSRQIGPEQYYGSGGAITRVSDLTTALKAIDEIIGQGEGIPHSIWSESGATPDRADFLEVAHFYRFLEIRKERRYRGDEKVPPENGKYPLPTGEKLNVCWGDVYPMRKNPKMADLPSGSEVLKKSIAFNRTYTDLLNTLNAAMNGKPDLIMKSVGIMYELKYQAIELMKIPMPGCKDETVGPSFEFLG